MELASGYAPGIRIVGIEETVRAAVADAITEQRHDASPWLNVADTAEYLRTTEDAVRAMVRRGDLPVHRTGTGRLLFHREELDDFATAGDA